ncbi:MAG: dTDP-4-dehydrorhamnose 3,5-epimerase [Burkholderiaceae bacterium]
MKASPCAIPDLLLIEPLMHGDERGFLFESFNRREFARLTSLWPDFVQDNHSRSGHNVLRGLHYQVHQPQGKLVRVVVGEVFDVAVDLRRSETTFGQWCGHVLSQSNRQQLWIPPGFAHGFLVLSDAAEVEYKTTDYYAPEHERCIAWDDPALAIEWPLHGQAPVLSARDAAGKPLASAELPA